MTQNTGASSSKKVTLKAPLSGPLMQLESVPDPVFAQKMVGDGISIDPLDQLLLAPCNGEVLQLHSAGHALTLLAEEGLEVMIHVGLDTVELNGRGFRPRVKAGDRVATGDVLIEFDADYIASHATSLLTQVVITNSELVVRFDPRSGAVKAGEDDLIDLWLGGVPPEQTAPRADTRTPHHPAEQPDSGRDRQHTRPGSGIDPGLALHSGEISIRNRSGLHARPAAVLANLARRFSADISLQRGSDLADAKSIIALMELNVGYRDRVRLLASGEDAGQALTDLVPLLAAGLGDEEKVPAPKPTARVAADAQDSTGENGSEEANLLHGLTLAPGLAIGTVYQLGAEQIEVQEFARSPHAEQQRLDEALRQAGAKLRALQARMQREVGAGKATIFAAHEQMLQDPQLIDSTMDAIAQGKSAAWAWQHAVNRHADQLAGSANTLLAERANDLRDLGARVLHLLAGGSSIRQRSIPEQSVVVTEELTPSTTAGLDRDNVRGFCTVLGSASSHVAILARALNLPAVAGVDSRVLDIAEGTPVILDGNHGTLRTNPTQQQLQEAVERQQLASRRQQEFMQHCHEPAVTRDGVAIEVSANIASLEDMRQAVGMGADGVGLVRTEFLFLDRDQPPDEQEQLHFYRDIAAFLGPQQRLVIRTLDLGGDKPVAYLPLPSEDNPFLGERGIRVSLEHPDLLRQQVRAVLRIGAKSRIALMLPMVSSLDEYRRARTIVEDERQTLGLEPIELGIMIEVPAAALMARQFAQEVDFFSIGSNDLSQYTLAIDRDHPRLAAGLDGLNPAILQLIAAAAEGASAENKWISICGAMSSDPIAVPFLLGLGITSLSCSAPDIPVIKARVRSLEVRHCRELVQQALRQTDAEQVRALSPQW